MRSWSAQLTRSGRGRGNLPRAERVLVPVGGSSMDESALQLAGEIAHASGGVVYAVYIIEVPRAIPLDADLDDQTDRAEATLARIEDRWPNRKVKMATEMLQARQAGPAIVTEAIERRADLIVMGIDHERRYGDYALNVAAAHVLQHAPSAVWILRKPIAQNGTGR